jgi:ketosteroid isomerase-like protein
MSHPNVILVQNLYAAFISGRIDTIIAALTLDVDWQVNGRRKDFPTLGVWRGPQEIQQFFAAVGEHEAFSDLSPKEFHAASDKVFVLGHYAGAVRKTGCKIDSDWLHVFTIRGGKVAQFREFTDTAQFADAFRG